jgi:murein DD-endopeptidase MepM/ murein hydrolase activator NlpD
MRPLALLALVLAVLVGAPGPAAADSGGPAVWPLQPQPEVVHRFDPPDDPWGAGHRGVDLLGHPGQEVHAALGGTVSFAGTLAGRGVVVVSHGDTRTTYEPVDPGVAVGEVVATGAVIGRLEGAMSHCFPRTCLHWGLLRGGQYLDPLSLLGVAPVRLLPLVWPLSLPLFLPGLLMPWGAPAGRPFAAVPR